MISREEARKEPFPYVMVEKGFRILMDKGTEAFNAFAKSVDMPTEDINRIYSKRKYIEEPEYRAKIKSMKNLLLKKMNLNPDDIPF